MSSVRRDTQCVTTGLAAGYQSGMKNIGPMGISNPRDDLKATIAPIASTLSGDLAALLAAVLDGRKKKTLDRLSKALSEAVPLLLERAIEGELLANGDAHERRSRLVAVLRARETPVKLPQTKSAGKLPGDTADESKDWMSDNAVAQLLNVSLAHVKELSQGGKLGRVHTKVV